jgi:peptidyl-prolyl cis-trans isomerase A (cyclophilin A)
VASQKNKAIGLSGFNSSGVYMLGLPKVARAIVYKAAQTLLLLLAISVSAQANTIVRVSTTFGDFSLELFDDVTPVTVQNFLNYVNRGVFNGSYFHRLNKGFVLQGGGYSFVPFTGPVNIPTDSPIVNEFSESNVRGTVAMAKFGGDPDSATSQWFVNLGDNSANLDAQNGGFTAFGRVLGDGMLVLDTINELTTYNFGTQQTELPLYNFDSSSSLTAANFVTMNTEVMQRFSSALNVFESNTGLLIATVDGGETLGTYSLNLSLIADQPSIQFQLNGDSLVLLGNKPDERATFSDADNKLRIPSLELNMNGNISVIRNVVLGLSDASNWIFTLETYDQ